MRITDNAVSNYFAIGYRGYGNFARRYGHRGNGRLEYGLDYIKAMPQEWTDEQRWAMMVQLYDELRIGTGRVT